MVSLESFYSRSCFLREKTQNFTSVTSPYNNYSPCKTPATLQPRVKRSISVDIPLTSSMISTCSEDNLDPIEEVEDPEQQIVLHLQQPPIIDCVSSTPPTGTIMILDCMLTYYT